MSPYNDEATLKRQAALSRVRQRRAEHFGATEAPAAAAVVPVVPVVPVEEPPAAVGAWLTCPEPKVPKDFARTAPAAMHWKNLEPATWMEFWWILGGLTIMKTSKKSDGSFPKDGE